MILQIFFGLYNLKEGIDRKLLRLKV